MFTAHDLIGRIMVDHSGRRAGRVTAFYRYPVDFDAQWGVAAVTKGLLFKSTRLVDLRDAQLKQDNVVVPHSIATILAAPNYTPFLGDVLTGANATEVIAHYHHQP